MESKPFFRRLLGQETEYAIRFTPAPGFERPRNSVVYEALRFGIRNCVHTKSSERDSIQEQFFVENGGSFNYEHQPFMPLDGLIEGATPECSGAGELLLYQRSQEALLKKALPYASEYLKETGYFGDLGLIKNCRDSEGHIYGAQENYEANLASGFRLFLYRLGLLLFLPPFTVFFWSVSVITFTAALCLFISCALLYTTIRALLTFLGSAFRSMGLPAGFLWR